MAAIHAAKCPCGFQRSVSSGGIRATFQTLSNFPFYCVKCGLVSVNVHAEKIACPQCDSSDINQYGLPPISLGKLSEKDYPVVQCFRYGAYSTGNLCPACKQMTLVFEPPGAIFD
jgi:hypothetical protein